VKAMPSLPRANAPFSATRIGILTLRSPHLIELDVGSWPRVDALDDSVCVVALSASESFTRRT
jgi:hypothetical protein